MHSTKAFYSPLTEEEKKSIMSCLEDLKQVNLCKIQTRLQQIEQKRQKLLDDLAELNVESLKIVKNTRQVLFEVQDSLLSLCENGWPEIPSNRYHIELITKRSKLTADDVNCMLFKIGYENQRIADSLHREACKLLESNNIDQVLYLLEASLDMTNKFSPRDQRRKANLYNSFGRAYAKSQKIENAVKYIDQARKIGRDIGDQLIVATSEYTTSYIHYVKNEPEISLKLLDKCLKVRQAVLGDHNDTANTVEFISTIYRQQRRMKKAIQYRESACGIRERMLNGQCNLPYYLTVRDLAILLISNKNRKKAAEIVRKAAEIYKEVEGLGPYDVFKEFVYIGNMFKDVEDWISAEVYYLKALATGFRDKYTAMVYENLIFISRKLKQGQNEEAYEKRLKDLKTEINPDNGEILDFFLGVY